MAHREALAATRELELFGIKSVLDDKADFHDMRRVQITTQRLEELCAVTKAAHSEAEHWRTALVEQLQRKVGGWPFAARRRLCGSHGC